VEKHHYNNITTHNREDGNELIDTNGGILLCMMIAADFESNSWEKAGPEKRRKFPVDEPVPTY
jgi:hypothetical protein